MVALICDWLSPTSEWVLIGGQLMLLTSKHDERWIKLSLNLTLYPARKQDAEITVNMQPGLVLISDYALHTSTH